ncbi:MAG: UDP-galactopyranose mutase [Luminiphilus sp.]|nr:UDP-galactopyranose mutase [Luminiphilus sp.]
MVDYLIVGAGLFGATVARGLMDSGHSCLVIDRRHEIGGNCATTRLNGVVIHQYGPHIFHTNSTAIWEFVQRYCEFEEYVNAPKARTESGFYSLPFNMNTFEEFWGITDPGEARKRIYREAANPRPTNLEEKAVSMVGRELYEEFIFGYTLKQWGRVPRDLPPSIIGRIPVRFTYDNNYYDHIYQGIPKDGYSALISNLLSGAEVLLGIDYLSDRNGLDKVARHVIYTGSLDALCDFRFGRLPYRSITFDTQYMQQESFQSHAVINFCSLDEPYTRSTEHKYFSGRFSAGTYVTREIPCEYDGSNIPCYPINDRTNNELHAKYRSLVAGRERFSFGGRLAQYRYMDMDMVIASAIKLAGKLNAKYA